MASLLEADWKKVLDQPKNGGLKLLGTGVSKALRNLHDAEDDLKKQPNDKNGRAVYAKLMELRTQIKTVTDKHRKTFTTACQYLDDVKKLADARSSTLDDQMDEIRARDHLRERAAEFRALKDKALQEVRGAKDMNQLNALWKAFGDKLGTFSHEFPKLQNDINKIKAFKKEADPKVGILGVRADYVEAVNGLNTP